MAYYDKDKYRLGNFLMTSVGPTCALAASLVIGFVKGYS